MKDSLKIAALIFVLFTSIILHGEPGLIEIVARQQIVHISIEAKPHKTLSLVVYNSKGEIFKNLKLYTSTDITLINLHLPKGVYYINVMDIDCGCSNSKIKIDFI